jgi:hypothetical protein
MLYNRNVSTSSRMPPDGTLSPAGFIHDIFLMGRIIAHGANGTGIRGGSDGNIRRTKNAPPSTTE